MSLIPTDIENRRFPLVLYKSLVFEAVNPIQTDLTGEALGVLRITEDQRLTSRRHGCFGVPLI